ncbi:histidine phosphatase family protein [Exilibacterium tricleocarpae]|uniref:Histidine phosphatase family protein n=1 Tax=Exilibacterium tricleocarpae TaxID=2591008 RepID=A0A545U984_9GAMM|nr:histidine phosphatase family protein [Exilibacterium tricleocarpae]TQV86040.1 histidine phosphatase family protein [Exilibacterium tricleocarpae]
MSEFFLVRHGQASFGAENYDKLSPLGHQQARWLGDYFAARDIHFERVLIGDLVRHRETAQSLCEALPAVPEFDIHTGLNEFDFYRISVAYLAIHPEQQPPAGASAREFYGVLKRAMQAWRRGELEGELPETWAQFEQRVGAALSYICETKTSRPTLVVSSGGAMAMLLRHVLDFDGENVINLNMQMKNTGVSHFYYSDTAVRLSSFNNVPHLDIDGRSDSITFS